MYQLTLISLCIFFEKPILAFIFLSRLGLLFVFMLLVTVWEFLQTQFLGSVRICLFIALWWFSFDLLANRILVYFLHSELILIFDLFVWFWGGILWLMISWIAPRGQHTSILSCHVPVIIAPTYIWAFWPLNFLTISFFRTQHIF